MAAKKGQPRPEWLKGGSRKGKPNKMSLAVKDMILAALDGVGGIKYLKQQAKANPAAFMQLLGKTITQRSTVTVRDANSVRELTTDEILQAIAAERTAGAEASDDESHQLH